MTKHKSYKERWTEHFSRFEEEFPHASFEWVAEMADQATEAEAGDLVDQAYEEWRERDRT